MDKKHILFAEDDEQVRELASFALENAGFKVTTVEDGSLALQRLIELSKSDALPDLILTDVQMPELDGLGLMDEMKKLGMNIPVIAITGFLSKSMISELLAKGFVDYLEKPFGADDVVEFARYSFKEFTRLDEV